MEFTFRQSSISPDRTEDHGNMKQWNVFHFMFPYPKASNNLVNLWDVLL